MEVFRRSCSAARSFISAAAGLAVDGGEFRRPRAAAPAPRSGNIRKTAQRVSDTQSLPLSTIAAKCFKSTRKRDVSGRSNMAAVQDHRLNGITRCEIPKLPVSPSSGPWMRRTWI